MTLGLSIVDLLPVGVFLAAALGIGVWARRDQHASVDFLLANRCLPWWPLGMSLALAGSASAYYCTAPLEAYWVGLKLLLVPLLIWTAFPLVYWVLVPLYGRLELESVYEYLELRFNSTVRAIAGIAYLVGTLLVLGCVLILPAKALGFGQKLDAATVALIVAAGTIATLSTYLGGMKGRVWTDVARLILLLSALALLIFFIRGALDDGLGTVWKVAERLGRKTVVDPSAGFAAKWSPWASVAYLALVPWFFYVADQSTLQRLFAVRQVRDMMPCYLLGTGLFCLLAVLAMYVGLGLLAVYQEHPVRELPARWIVRSAEDPKTGHPLIAPDAEITPENIGPLIEERKILKPNVEEPFTDVDEVLDHRGQIDIRRLAQRTTRLKGGEYRLTSGRHLLLAQFIKRHVPWGLAGIVLAALVAAATSLFDAGLVALTTLVMVDFHRRFGWAELWLVDRCGKDPDDLDQADEMRLARPVVLALGTVATLASLVLCGLGVSADFIFTGLGIFAGPLLGIFLLGMFTRRTTATGAAMGLVAGLAAAVWAAGGHLAVTLLPIWPWATALGPFWPFVFGIKASILVGYVASIALGQQKTREELSGLVVGLGRLGILKDAGQSKSDEVYWIEVDDQRESPWK